MTRRWGPRLRFGSTSSSGTGSSRRICPGSSCSYNRGQRRVSTRTKGISNYYDTGTSSRHPHRPYRSSGTTCWPCTGARKHCQICSRRPLLASSRRRLRSLLPLFPHPFRGLLGLKQKCRTSQHEDGAHSVRYGRWLKPPREMRTSWSQPWRSWRWHSITELERHHPYGSRISTKLNGQCGSWTVKPARDGLLGPLVRISPSSSDLSGRHRFCWGENEARVLSRVGSDQFKCPWSAFWLIQNSSTSAGTPGADWVPPSSLRMVPQCNSLCPRPGGRPLRCTSAQGRGGPVILMTMCLSDPALSPCGRGGNGRLLCGLKP